MNGHVTLATAGTALWSATLSLMTAYLHATGPAHRLLLARRIAANFGTLTEQQVFSSTSRASFSRLHLHWQATATELARVSAPAAPGGGLLAGLARLTALRL